MDSLTRTIYIGKLNKRLNSKFADSFPGTTEGYRSLKRCDNKKDMGIIYI